MEPQSHLFETAPGWNVFHGAFLPVPHDAARRCLDLLSLVPALSRNAAATDGTRILSFLKCISFAAAPAPRFFLFMACPPAVNCGGASSIECAGSSLALQSICQDWAKHRRNCTDPTTCTGWQNATLRS